LQAVRKAIEFLSRKFPGDHPLLSQEMLTDGQNLFIEQYGHFVSISEDGQLALKTVFEQYLQRIVRDNEGVPIRLFPFTRPKIEQSPKLIVIDPRIRSGNPCLTGTRIPTSIIAERHQAGDSIATLAEDYERPQEEIEEAIRYESRAAA
jgi:uncharacterized protein (DUF433 family)